MVQESERNVFTWLEDVRRKPTMYLRDTSLTELESLIWGYYFALGVHGITELVPSMDRHFLHWLHYRDRIENGELLMTGAGDYATTLRYAKQGVRDELQVEFVAWNRVTKSGQSSASMPTRG